MTEPIDNAEDWVAGYDAANLMNEPRPNNVVYNPIFSELKDEIHELADMLRAPLRRTGYNNPVVDSLKQEISAKTKEDHPEEVIFAIAGDMASGKSSVVNSVLGQGIIARKGNSGSSCTAVVQRFRKMFPNQESPYAAEVHFFSSTEISGIIKAHFAKYYNAYRRSTGELEGGGDKEDESDAVTEMRTVLDAFIPLFGEYDEFADEDSAQTFLGSATSEDDPNMLSMLTGWAEDMISKFLAGNTCVRINACTTDELLRLLEQFTSTINGGEGLGMSQPWLLVKVVDLGLNIPMLNDGIIIVDSPGTSDANSIRAKNAAQYHRRCSHMIHVANISRAVDDKSLRDAMQSAYRQRGPRNTILVLTHGDDMDEDTILRGPPAAKAKERALHDTIKELRDQVNSNRGQRKRQRLNNGDMFDLHNRAEALNSEITKATNDWRLCRIGMRNESTKAAIQSLCKKQRGDPHPMPVIVVANEQYKLHQAGYYEYEPPFLDVKATGIPALRERIYSQPAEGRLKETLHVAEHQLPSLINSFELYCAKAHIEKRSELEAMILEPKRHIKMVLDQTYDRLMKNANDLLLGPIQNEEDRWSREARKLCRRWALHHATNFLAILRNKGFKKGRRKNDSVIDWNFDLMSISSEALDSHFRRMQGSLKQCLLQTADECGKLMTSCREKIRKDENFQFMAIRPLLESFDLERPNARKCFEKASRALRREISIVTNDALSCPADGHFAMAMFEVYRTVQKITGRGAPAKRLAEFEKRVCLYSGVWIDFHDRIRDALHNVFKTQLKELRADLNKVFDGLHRKFTMMCEDTHPKTDEEVAQEALLIDDLNKVVVRARQKLQGPISRLVVECKEYGRN